MRRAGSGAASTPSGEASIGRMAGINARLSYKRNRRRSETLDASVNPDNPQHWAALFPRGRPFYEERVRGARRGTATDLSEAFCRSVVHIRQLREAPVIMLMRIAAAAFLCREGRRLREPHARTQLDFLKSSEAR
jgi:hypothetical protein